MKTGDRNRRVYYLTERGRAMLETATPYWLGAQQRMRRELGDMAWNELSEFAERITQAALRAEVAPSRNGHTRASATKMAH